MPRAERQSARMSKITRVTVQLGLARDALYMYPYGNSGRQRANSR